MYALPSRQRRRNNYSRTLLADRDGDMLPHLSRKQLLSVKELLICSGLVHAVSRQSITYRDLVTFPRGDPSSSGIPIHIPLLNPGYRLNRVELKTGDSNFRYVYYACNSKSDGTGTNHASGNVPVYNATQDILIQYPDSIRPYLIYSSPSLEDVVASPQNLLYFSSNPVSPNLQYYPILTFFFQTLPVIDDSEIADRISCYLYYTN